MSSWQEIEKEVPEFAARARALFDRHRHKTMATLRRDGSPRISGTELEFRDGEVWLGSMGGALKARDLRRDPRVAVHSGSDDPDDADPGSWSGDVKFAGRALEVEDPASKEHLPGEGSHLFRVDVAELVITRVDAGGQFLVVEMWHEGRGLSEVRRK
ncbi:pyridoxamine 5'-phosphate oxidase family protein [Streptosporangiaceae bacterium NEAU-GS5]|nr:pyridoxamine 5'-phosphate oxidase family protein [Streptosporangiaceae bacterium NEAU-GS5]